MSGDETEAWDLDPRDHNRQLSVTTTTTGVRAAEEDEEDTVSSWNSVLPAQLLPENELGIVDEFNNTDTIRMAAWRPMGAKREGIEKPVVVAFAQGLTATSWQAQMRGKFAADQLRRRWEWGFRAAFSILIAATLMFQWPQLFSVRAFFILFLFLFLPFSFSAFLVPVMAFFTANVTAGAFFC
jgi:hypothetical protein